MWVLTKLRIGYKNSMQQHKEEEHVIILGKNINNNCLLASCVRI